MNKVSPDALDSATTVAIAVTKVKRIKSTISDSSVPLTTKRCEMCDGKDDVQQFIKADHEMNMIFLCKSCRDNYSDEVETKIEVTAVGEDEDEEEKEDGFTAGQSGAKAGDSRKAEDADGSSDGKSTTSTQESSYSRVFCCFKRKYPQPKSATHFHKVVLNMYAQPTALTVEDSKQLFKSSRKISNNFSARVSGGGSPISDAELLEQDPFASDKVVTCWDFWPLCCACMRS